MGLDRGKQKVERKLTQMPKDKLSNLELDSHSRVAVIGGGPAGSFFSYFLLDMAQRVNIDIQVDIYEQRDFSQPGPIGCNMCGGIVSESLVQILASEGINLPTTVVQRGIESYVLHMDVGSVRIETPLNEKRIAAVHRGAGPRGLKEVKWNSFDGYLLRLAMSKGAHLIRERVDSVGMDGRPFVKTQGGSSQTYDLLVVAVGVKTSNLKLFEGLGLGYKPPQTTRTYICEFYLGQEMVKRYLGSSMHVFLLNIHRLEFGALIPKGDYITLCLLGQKIDKFLVKSFLNAPQVKQCFPTRSIAQDCLCYPLINVQEAKKPFADRVVFIGDCGVTRLYKDGIGAAYRTAKAAALTAIFEGISAKDFRQHYLPVCQAISTDNKIGRVVFAITRLIQTILYARRGVFSMVSREQQKRGGQQRMSTVLWDTFTGSAPYKDILLRTLNPFFLGCFLWNIVVESRSLTKGIQLKEDYMETGALGKVYKDGEVIFREGEEGDCMYVIQIGQVEVLQQKHNKEIHMAILGEGDFFGEMALFDRKARSATVRALGEVRLLTVDKRTFLRRIQEDPSLAFHIVQNMSQRIHKLNAELTRIKTELNQI